MKKHEAKNEPVPAAHEGRAATAGNMPDPSFKGDREALEAEVRPLDYGLVYETLKGKVLVFKSGLVDHYEAADWAAIAKLIANRLINSANPRVRQFLDRHKVKQVAIRSE